MVDLIWFDYTQFNSVQFHSIESQLTTDSFIQFNSISFPIEFQLIHFHWIPIDWYKWISGGHCASFHSRVIFHCCIIYCMYMYTVYCICTQIYSTLFYSTLYSLLTHCVQMYVSLSHSNERCSDWLGIAFVVFVLLPVSQNYLLCCYCCCSDRAMWNEIATRTPMVEEGEIAIDHLVILVPKSDWDWIPEIGRTSLLRPMPLYCILIRYIVLYRIANWLSSLSKSNPKSSAVPERGLSWVESIWSALVPCFRLV